MVAVSDDEARPSVNDALSVRLRMPRVNHLAGLDTVEALDAKMTEVRKTRRKLEKADRAHTAIANLHRLEFDIIKKLDEVRAASPEKSNRTQYDNLTDEELHELHAELVARLPGFIASTHQAALDERAAGPVLEVVEGGE